MGSEPSNLGNCEACWNLRTTNGLMNEAAIAHCARSWEKAELLSSGSCGVAGRVRQVLAGRRAIWATDTKVRGHRKRVLEAFTERKNQRKMEMKEKKGRLTERKIKRKQKKRKRKERKKEVLGGWLGAQLLKVSCWFTSSFLEPGLLSNKAQACG